MSDEAETNTSTIETQGTGDAGQTSDVTTPPDFQAALAAERQKAHDAAYAKARREFEAKSKEPKSKAAEVVSAPPTVTDDRAFEDNLSDALADVKLSREQKQLVRKLARMEKPGDVDSFVTGLARTFGPAPAAAAGNPNPNPQGRPPQAAPAAAAPAPATSVPGDGPESIRKMSEESWQARIAKNGANPANPYHWSNRAAHAEIARQLEGELSKFRIVPSK